MVTYQGISSLVKCPTCFVLVKDVDLDAHMEYDAKIAKALLNIGIKLV